MSEEINYVLAEKDYIAGMKYKDIAEKYSVSLNTVKSWKTRYGWSKKSVHTKKQKVCTQKTEELEAVKKTSENNELTDKQQLFCVYFVKCFNATKAYQKAYQCDYKTALCAGPRMLGNDRVKSEIEQMKQAKLNQVYLSEEDIFQKYMDIAFSDITDYVEFGRETVPVMGPFGPIQVKDEKSGKKVELTKVVNAVRFKESVNVDGTIITEVKQGRDGVSIKLADKMKALNWLADHMNIATEKQKAEIALIKAKANLDDGSITEDDGFIDALKGMVSNAWQEK